MPAARRRQPVLDDRAAAALARYGTRIADHFGAPQDIEWARAGDEFFILQSRPITALPEPAADTPDTWPVPYPNGLYFRASIVEQLPDPLSPLFADLIDGSVSRSLRALMAEAVGKNVIREDDVGLPTINGYAYYYYRTSAMWRVMGKSLTAMRALARGKAHMGVAGWREFSHPRYERGDQGLVGEARRGALRSRNCWRVCRRCWTPAPCTTRPCSQSFRSPRQAKSPSGRTTTSSFGATEIRPPRRSSSATTANPSGRRSRCTTSRPGPGTFRGWPRRSSMHRRRRWPSRSAPGPRLPGVDPAPVAAVASPLPGPPRPVRPCGLQPGLRQPGAGRRSLAAAGDGEVLPAGTGQ